jgi:outer membrane immunogenic protein
MKKISLVFAMVLCTMGVFAQEGNKTARIADNNLLLNFGIGLSNWGIPVYGGLEYFVHRDISVGGVLGYQHYNNGWYGYDYSINTISATAVANYHFNHILNIPRKWDFYAGLNLGFYSQSISKPGPAPDYNGNTINGVGLGLQVGGRYYFARRWGLNLELAGGSSISDVKFGMTCKF